MSTRKTTPTNTRIVSQPSDLPYDSTAGEHILEDNTVYRFDGFVSSSNPIRLGNNTPLIGNHAGTDGFIHTGGSDAIRGNNKNVLMRNLYCHAPGGTIFNVNGDVSKDLLIESASFSDAAGIGNIADLGTIGGFRVPTFKGNNFESFDSGMTFSDNGGNDLPDKVFVSACPFRNVSASGVTCLTFGTEIGIGIVDIGDCYFKEFQSDTEIARVETGATPTQVFQYRGNTHDSTVTKDNILTGEAGSNVVGYSVQNSAPLPNSSAVAEVSNTDSVTTTISTTGNWKRLANGITLSGASERFSTTATTGQFEYVGRIQRKGTASASLTVTGGNGTSYSLAFAVNGSVRPETTNTFTAQGTNSPVNVALSGVASIQKNDTLSLFVRNNDDTNDFTADSFNISVFGI